MNSKRKIMIVDDEENIVQAFMLMFERDGYVGISAGSGKEAIQKIDSENPSVVFMDITMPDSNGLETLEQIKQKNIDMPVIIITGYGTMQTAVKAIQLGAYEYITKPLDIEKIRITLGRALETANLRAEIKHLKVDLDYKTEKHELIGNSVKMQEVYKAIGSVSSMPNVTTVLILGETGTGKELVARAIHRNGSAANGPFVTVNCAGFPETLLESELFGHEKGSFTGATDRKIGKFEFAKEGTIFLDEISNLSMPLQQKLLRVLQEREFERIGSNEILKVKARFVSASNQNLEEEVAKGNFREDLFFRLNVFTIKLPPLRERKDDIPLLTRHFLAKYKSELKKDVNRISDEALAAICTYEFPGNVRELENIIERCVILEKGNVITRESLPDNFDYPGVSDVGMPMMSTKLNTARKNVLEAFEKKFIIERLTSNNGSVTKAAREAQIERQSFQRLMRKYGIVSGTFKK
jgi:two-component system response regulator AtoC